MRGPTKGACSRVLWSGRASPRGERITSPPGATDGRAGHGTTLNGRAGGDHRHGLPVPRGGEPRRVLAAAGGGRERRDRGRTRIRGRAHRRALPRRRGAERGLPVRRVRRRDRPVRCVVLPHLAGRGAAAGPAAADDAGDELAGAGGRGDRRGGAGGQPHGRLRGDQQLRLPVADHGLDRLGGADHQPLLGERHVLQHGHRARCVCAGPARARDGGRHRLLVVAGGGSPGGGGACSGAKRTWRWPAASTQWCRGG